MLVVENLRIRFSRYDGLLRRREVIALDGVDLDVRAGEMVAVVGQSGAGKSLLAHAVLGVLPANAHVEGRMTFEGSLLDNARQCALRGRRIALIPQGINWLDPTATAGKQARWGALAAGKLGDRHAIAAEFTRFDLAERVCDAFPHELSGGMARRVLTAIATISRADLLIADEPTTGLDPDVRDISMKLHRTLADQGHAVMVITHDLAVAVRWADRIVVLCDGRSVETLPAERFRAGEFSHPYTHALRAALPEYGFHAPVVDR